MQTSALSVNLDRTNLGSARTGQPSASSRLRPFLQALGRLSRENADHRRAVQASQIMADIGFQRVGCPSASFAQVLEIQRPCAALTPPFPCSQLTSPSQLSPTGGS
jgi:hypothetical protein